MEHLGEIVDTVCREMQAHPGHGRVADYIPALARIDIRRFGIAIAVHTGQAGAPVRVFSAGDATTAFSVQSISRVFTLTMAREKLGGALWKRVGKEPSGSPFNSIVQLENEHGVPRNPLINAGALAVTDALLGGGDPARLIAGILYFTRAIADDPAVTIDTEVAKSEGETGFRNASLVNFLRAFGDIESDVQDVLQVYFHQCALKMDCRQLARAAIAVWSPGLNAWGNSHAGVLALERLSSLTKWSVF